MGIYFDESGNLTTNKPASKEAWDAHFSYRKEAENDPIQRKVIRQQTRAIVAQQEQEKIAKKLRVNYLRAGGDPTQWGKVKDAIMAAYLEGAAVEGMTNKKTPKRRQIRL